MKNRWPEKTTVQIDVTSAGGGTIFDFEETLDAGGSSLSAEATNLVGDRYYVTVATGSGAVSEG